jgi:HSP20 family molecular chaperone IbpA
LPHLISQQIPNLVSFQMFLTLEPRRFQQHPWTAHPLCRVQGADEVDLLTPFHILSALANSPQRNNCSRKRKESEERKEEQVEKKSRFEWKVNVEGYGPEELDVKLLDNCLVVSGKHEHSDQNGSISRNFTRKLVMPEDVELEELCCNFNSKDKTMQFSAPWKVKIVPQIKEKIIPISFTSQSTKEDHKEIVDSSSTEAETKAVKEDEILNKIASNDPSHAA